MHCFPSHGAGTRLFYILTKLTILCLALFYALAKLALHLFHSQDPFFIYSAKINLIRAFIDLVGILFAVFSPFYITRENSRFFSGFSPNNCAVFVGFVSPYGFLLRSYRLQFTGAWVLPNSQAWTVTSSACELTRVTVGYQCLRFAFLLCCSSAPGSGMKPFLFVGFYRNYARTAPAASCSAYMLSEFLGSFSIFAYFPPLLSPTETRSLCSNLRCNLPRYNCIACSVVNVIKSVYALLKPSNKNSPFSIPYGI